VTLLQAIILGIVQGLTEFIPISSTAHLRIVPALLGWKDPGAAASAVIQLGTLLAVFVYFSGDVLRLTKGFIRGLATRRPFADRDSALAWYVGLGSIPIAVVGLAFKDFIETGARNLWIIATMLIVMAILLYIAELYVARHERRTMEQLTLGDAIVVGLGQCIALIPGSSRSGSTMMAAMFRKLSHETAARFSFLLSIPAIFASGMLELVDQREHLIEVGALPVVVATVVSGVVGWGSIYWLLRYLRTHRTTVFIWYRIALGVLMIGLLSAGVLQPMG
jgi:undecaprenyl-diphosphatase